jgi:hypothetical protein
MSSSGPSALDPPLAPAGAPALLAFALPALPLLPPLPAAGWLEAVPVVGLESSSSEHAVTASTRTSADEKRTLFMWESPDKEKGRKEITTRGRAIVRGKHRSVCSSADHRIISG